MIEAIIVAILALLGAGGTFWGYRKGKAAAKGEQAQKNAKSAQDAKDNRHDIESQDDQRLVDILSGRVRDNNR